VLLGLDLPRDQLVDEGAGGRLDVAVGLGQAMAFGQRASCSKEGWWRPKFID